MHDLVVGQRQHEVLGEGVQQPEREVAVVVATVHRVVLEVAERVVHPAHVPLVAEAEAAVVDGPAHHRPRRRLLGDHHHAGMLGEHDGVQLSQEVDGVEVLAAAESVGHPLARLARVVEVQHRGDGVDAQPVDVELVEPVEGVGDEEVADLVAAVVEDERAPVGVLALAGVGVLVQRGAVEAGQRPVVAGEVGRHPVDDDADAPLVEVVDEEPEVVGRAEARAVGA